MKNKFKNLCAMLRLTKSQPKEASLTLSEIEEIINDVICDITLGHSEYDEIEISDFSFHIESYNQIYVDDYVIDTLNYVENIKNEILSSIKLEIKAKQN